MNISMQVENIPNNPHQMSRTIEVVDISSNWVKENPDLANVSRPLKAAHFRQELQIRSL